MTRRKKPKTVEAPAFGYTDVAPSLVKGPQPKATALAVNRAIRAQGRNR